jgi:hypothetical protein
LPKKNLCRGNYQGKIFSGEYARNSIQPYLVKDRVERKREIKLFADFYESRKSEMESGKRKGAYGKYLHSTPTLHFFRIKNIIIKRIKA